MRFLFLTPGLPAFIGLLNGPLHFSEQQGLLFRITLGERRPIKFSKVSEYARVHGAPLLALFE